MSAEYEIAKYRPELKDLVAELQKELWSSDASLNRRVLEWKYEKNPYLGEPLIYLALHQGKAVGMRGFHGARWEAGTPSRVFPALVAGDALVSAPHRDRGLVTRIMKAALADLAERGCRYLFTLGGSPVNVFGLLTLGWKSVGALRPMGQVTTKAMRNQGLRRMVKRLPFVWKYQEARFLYSADERRPFRHLDAARPGCPRGDGASVTIDRRPRPKAMAELVQRLGHDGRVRHVRDSEYLTWRFENPLSEYRFLYWEKARLEGYLVLQRSLSDLADWVRVRIADLEASDMRIRSELLPAAVSRGRFPELVTWTVSLSDAEVQLLKNLGFTPVDPEQTTRGCPCVLVRSLRENLPETEWVLGDRWLLDMKNWDIRMLYSMQA